jgi:hypothetical protein
MRIDAHTHGDIASLERCRRAFEAGRASHGGTSGIR